MNITLLGLAVVFWLFGLICFGMAISIIKDREFAFSAMFAVFALMMFVLGGYAVPF